MGSIHHSTWEDSFRIQGPDTTAIMMYFTVCLLATVALSHAAVLEQRAAGTNVARGKPVEESSIYSVTNPASYVTDGDTSSTFRVGGHCGHTGWEKNPYFVIDLGDSIAIDSIELWTREDTGVASTDNRDRDYDVRIGDSPYHPNNPVCAKFNGVMPQKVEASCAGGAMCGRYISIQRTSDDTTYMHLCEVMAYATDPTPGCVPPDAYVAECQCSGDPHCNSFDGKWLHYQGACIYTLAQDNCEDGVPNGDPSWSVTANFDREGSEVSYVRQVTVTMHDDDLVIEMRQDRVVLVNGERLMGSPATNDDVTISITPNQVYIAVEGGIRVRWDGTSIVKVEVQEQMKGTTCGICGNFNGDADDDWTVGPSDQCMDGFDEEAGDITDNTEAMGNSWTAAIDENEEACGKECPVPPTDCTNGATKESEDHCAPLKDPNGPFKECLAQMDEFQAKDLFDNCVYDSCHLQDYETVVCEHAASMNMICNAMYGVTVVWRGKDLCGMEGGENMEYKACGEPCVPTCNDLEGEECGELGACTEGCFCKDGYVYDQDGKCIKKEECGCLDPETGLYVNVGESLVREGCDEQCTCEEEKGKLQCKKMECPENQVCVLRDGEYGCYCEPPFSMIDNECAELPYPCETEVDGEKETLDLECLTCKNAKDDAECLKKGTMEKCTGEDPICVYKVNKNKDQEVFKVNRGCSTRKACAPESIGETAQKCTLDGLKSECTNCGYGPVKDDPTEGNEVYSCGAPPTEPPDVDPCILNKDGGEGSQSLTRWYFKLKKCKCMKFTYKGSGGNTNNFGSKAACEAKCTTFETPAD